MDTLQQQVIALSLKVDTLYQNNEKLSQQMAEVLTHIKLLNTLENPSNSVGLETANFSYTRWSQTEAVPEHKDVLTDSNYPNLQGTASERTLAPETQIRRLTAQLTAAYNRIAALEEQLLAQRVH